MVKRSRRVGCRDLFLCCLLSLRNIPEEGNTRCHTQTGERLMATSVQAGGIRRALMRARSSRPAFASLEAAYRKPRPEVLSRRIPCFCSLPSCVIQLIMICGVHCRQAVRSRIASDIDPCDFPRDTTMRNVGGEKWRDRRSRTLRRPPCHE